MRQANCQMLQKTVSEYLVRNRSILDVMTKLQDASSRINRAIAKTVTSCGCLNIDAKKQDIPDDVGYSEVASYVKSHLEGELCPNCAEVLETELGNALFYITAICCLLDLDLEKVMDRENDRINTLGAFSLT
ncbi:MAG: nucleoside triphosphate pyrophosphohydrolase family protein [Candidatus Geothermincolia bacterium]